ncbi:MAG: hypothetical protein ABJC12_05625 [Saprospiraceae bacterium]
MPFLYLISGCIMATSCHSGETHAGNYPLHIICKLPKELDECSGLKSLNASLFVALNDGGDKPVLYLFDLNKENAARKVKVSNVENNDWEEIETDNDFVYIGDTGNNGGTRHNLAIYKIKKTDLMSKDEVDPEKIMISYEGQTSFHDSNRHNFDCEAMVSVGDSLYLFSKNRGDHRTDVYCISKTPGTYTLRKLTSFDAMGLISGADYKTGSSGPELILIGYDIMSHVHHPFLIHFTGFSGTNFFTGSSSRIVLDQDLQTESVQFHGIDQLYISNEETKSQKGYLYSLTF